MQKSDKRNCDNVQQVFLVWRSHNAACWLFFRLLFYPTSQKKLRWNRELHKTERQQTWISVKNFTWIAMFRKHFSINFCVFHSENDDLSPRWDILMSDRLNSWRFNQHREWPAKSRRLFTSYVFWKFAQKTFSRVLFPDCSLFIKRRRSSQNRVTQVMNRANEPDFQPFFM